MKTLTIDGQDIEFQPCPFCGSDVLSTTDWWDDDGEFTAVSCLGCKAEAPATTWNSRAATWQ